MVKFKNNAIILFQGDSITDCSRDRMASDSLGNGYVSLIASQYQEKYPNKDVRFINKGISGNRTQDLVARWETDCLDLKPDLVSILIGINDTWRRYDSNEPTSVEQYEQNYRKILTQVRDELQVPIIILEPFLLPITPDIERWRADLDPKIQAARRLAREFATAFIPLDGLFAQASVEQPPAFWAADGVHPTDAGHQLIAEAWLKTNMGNC